MKLPDQSVLRAFVNLQAEADGKLILAWLDECLAEQDRENRRSDGPELYRGQGRALGLEEILSNVRTADKQLAVIGAKNARNERARAGGL